MNKRCDDVWKSGMEWRGADHGSRTGKQATKRSCNSEHWPGNILHNLQIILSLVEIDSLASAQSRDQFYCTPFAKWALLCLLHLLLFHLFTLLIGDCKKCKSFYYKEIIYIAVIIVIRKIANTFFRKSILQ